MMRCYHSFIITFLMLLGTIPAKASTPVIPVRELKKQTVTNSAVSGLETLQQRYQCLDRYQKDQLQSWLTRYEFASLLHRCLQNIDHEVADQSLLQKLQNEFLRELSILRGRVDGITARTRELEITEFSPTTKLRGITNFVITESSQSGEITEPVFQARSRLNFNSSFTGQDQLLTRITVGNSQTPNLAQGTPEVTQTHQWQGNTDNEVLLSKLRYQFPVSDTTLIQVTPIGGEHRDYNLAAVNPWLEDDHAGTTTLSPFAQRNPILSLGGGTGVALSQTLTENLDFGMGYYSEQPSNPNQGLFGESYTVGTRLKWDATEELSFGVNYLHGDFEKGEFGFRDGLNHPAMGTAVVNETLAQFSTISNSYGVEVFWQPQSKMAFGGRLGYTDVEALNQGEGEIWNYTFSAVFPNLGQNNLGGIIIGAQPYLAHLENTSPLNNDIPWHLETFYRWQLSEQISITPGLLWQLNPNQDDTQANLMTSTIRMTIHF